MKTECEAPCEETKVGCEWVAEEEYDDFGDMIRWDLYCQKCYRYRNWDKDAYPAQDLSNTGV